MDIQKKRERLYKKYEAALDDKNNKKADRVFNELRNTFDSFKECQRWTWERISPAIIIKQTN